MPAVDLAAELVVQTGRAIVWLISDFIGELLIRGLGHRIVRLLYREHPTETQEWLYGCMGWLLILLLLWQLGC